MPVSKLPLSAVAECGVGPLLVHVTVSPWLMVIVAGAKLKSAIATEPLAAAMAFGLGASVSSRSSARTCGSGGAGAGSAGAGSAGAGSAGAACAGAGSAGASTGGAGSAAVVSVAGAASSCARIELGRTSAAIRA